jgi:hypothetical protein
LVRVRNLLYAGATVALALVSSPDMVRSALAAAAGTLFEAAPFLLAGVLATTLLRRRARIVDYIGCGCGRGASARSLPALAATWLVFGPFVAIARYLAALLVCRVLVRRLAGCEHDESPPNLLGELRAVFPAAILAGVAVQLFAAFDLARLTPVASGLAGAALGFGAAPCGLGAVALGATLRVRAPIAAAAFLCTAGIFDLRALGRAPDGNAKHDAVAYATLAAALAVVAWRHGDALIHPAFAIALGCSAVATAALAVLHRRQRASGARAAPVVMLLGAFLGAPPPQYHATETTLTDLFPGEHLTFTGALARDANTSAIVRYAITCCRADAAPIVVRLDPAPPYPDGTWLRVDGRIESGAHGELRLVPQIVERVAAPADPFLYR